MEKIFLLEMDNGESYEDYRSWIDAAFRTHRGAQEYLLQQGYIPYYIRKYNGEYDIYFDWSESDESSRCTDFVDIIEMELGD